MTCLIYVDLILMTCLINVDLILMTCLIDVDLILNLRPARKKLDCDNGNIAY